MTFEPSRFQTRAELEADVAGADHDQVLGYGVVGQGLRAGADAVAVELDARQRRGAGAGGHDHIPGLQLVLLLLAGDDDPAQFAVEAPEPGPTLDVLDPVLPEQRRDAASEGRHDAVLAFHHRRQIETDLAGDAAVSGEFAAGGDEALARLQQRLARNAAHAQADASGRRMLVDHGGPEAELRRSDRRDIAAGSSADDDEVEATVAHSITPAGRAGSLQETPPCR